MQMRGDATDFLSLKHAAGAGVVTRVTLYDAVPQGHSDSDSNHGFTRTRHSHNQPV